MNPFCNIPRTASLVILLLFLYIPSESQDIRSSPDKLSLLFIGDIMGHDDQIKASENLETGSYNYDDVFKYMKPLISDADIAVANFEVTLDGPPYMGYPQFSSPAALASACKKAGIDYLLTANNHSADRGIRGIQGTISRLDSIGVNHTGTFSDASERDKSYPLIITSHNISIALLNYTYGTNGMIVPDPAIINILDKDVITSDIQVALNKNPDIVILFLHWGTEYDTIPSKSQVDMAEYFFSEGVDIIIGSHPHVLQKMDWHKNNRSDKEKIVVYSLGNFVSNQKKPKTDGGSVVRVEIVRNGRSLNIADAGYFLTWVYTPMEEGRKKFFILPCSEFENKPGFFDNADDFFLMKRFIRDSRYFLNNQNHNFPEKSYTGITDILK